MTFLLMWCLLFLLSAAVIFLLWLQFKTQQQQHVNVFGIQQLENQLHNLETNLKKTLEIMQDLAKKMHVQQEMLDQTSSKVQQVDAQNLELITLISKVVNTQKNKNADE